MRYRMVKYGTTDNHRTMRLSPDQADTIRQAVHAHLGADLRLWLFGSRVDDRRRGGDIDLLVEADHPIDPIAALRCRGALADALDLRVDLAVGQPGDDRPIHRIARATGVRL